MAVRKGKLLDKEKYLSDPMVSDFVSYLVKVLKGGISVNHCITIRDLDLPRPDLLKRSRGCVWKIDTLEDAFKGYWWDRQGYTANANILTPVQTGARVAANVGAGSHANQGNLNALKDVLRWGAGGVGLKLYKSNVQRAVGWGASISQRLAVGRRAMISSAPDTFDFHAANPNGAWMNAGFTKYYALACDDVIIYDGRVGAALGLLVRKFCLQNGLSCVPDELSFMWGSQTGENPLPRDPSQGPYRFPKLNGQQPHRWAEWNIKANWVLVKAQHVAGAAWCHSTLSDGLRRIEAALFTIGYELGTSCPCQATGGLARASVDCVE